MYLKQWGFQSDQLDPWSELCVIEPQRLPTLTVQPRPLLGQSVVLALLLARFASSLVS